MEMETAMLESPYESFHNQEVKKSSDTSSMEKSSDASSMEKREKIYVWLCGVLTLTPIMLIMLMLLSLPTVFYTLQKKSRSIVPDNSAACSQVEPYSGQVCRTELTALQLCFSGASPALNIPTSINQGTSEGQAMLLVNGLSLANPSEECFEAIIPFLCLALFPLCDSDNNLRTILREDCLSLRDDICVEIWRGATQILGPGVLPICEELPDISRECIENSASAMPSTFTLSMSADLENEIADGKPLECPENFFSNVNASGSFCLPICGEFSFFQREIRILHKVVMCVCFIASVIMIVITFTIQRKKTLDFPLIVALYVTITTLFLSGVIILGFFDSSRFYCSSRDFVEATMMGAETGYCVFVSAVVNYCFVNLALWGSLLAAFLYWSVGHPFSFRQLKVTGRIRYAHITCILLSLIIPLPSAFAPLIDGSVFTTSLVLPCLALNADYVYSTVILPINILLGIQVVLLVLIIWILFKDFVLKKLLAMKKVTNVGVAELKVTAILVVNTVLGVTGLVTYIFADMEVVAESAAFIICVGSGGSNCSELTDRINKIGMTLPVTYTLLSLLPLMIILITCDVQAFKNRARTWKTWTQKCCLKN